MTKYKSVFISDVHLGTRHSRVNELLLFLKESEFENFFIVGDFVDGWALRRRWYWDNDHNLLIQKILRRSRKGCRTVYLTGNHDDFLRKFEFEGLTFGNIQICDEYIYHSLSGKSYLVIHGDKFDGIFNSLSFISKLGSWLYGFILNLNLTYNRARLRFGLGYHSLSHRIKTNVKEALAYATQYQDSLIFEARKQKVNGVICGHSHFPVMSECGGIDYYNCGCWVEMATCIVEHMDGRFELLKL